MKIDKNNYIQQLQLHNEDALVYVIETYGGLLKSVVHKHLFVMPEKAEDCLNDVFFCIWKDIDSFDAGRNTFKNWAAAVARYQAINYLRKYQRELQQTNIDDVVIPKEDAMLERLVEQEFSEEMESMLSCLNERDRQLFLKLYVEEQTIEEVSRETGVKKSVIYNRLSRGNITTEINKEDNGVKLLKATRTKGTIHLVIEEPNYSAKPYNDKFNDPDRAVSGKNGNMLEWLSGYHDMQEDGSCISYITLLDDGGEDYTFEVTNKNKDGGQIAKIKFHLDR